MSKIMSIYSTSILLIRVACVGASLLMHRPQMFRGELHCHSIPATDKSIEQDSNTSDSAAAVAGSAAAVSYSTTSTTETAASAGSAAAGPLFNQCMEDISGTAAADAGSAAAERTSTKSTAESTAIFAGSAADGTSCNQIVEVSAAISAGSAAARCNSEGSVSNSDVAVDQAALNVPDAVYVAQVLQQVVSLLPNIINNTLPVAPAKFSELIFDKTAEMIEESITEHLSKTQLPTETSSIEQTLAVESIYLKCEQLIDGKLSLSFHPATVCGAADDIIAEVVHDLSRAAASDALLLHNAALEYTGRYVQLQCLSKTEYNGNIGFVLGTLADSRLAVFVPSLGFRLSLKCAKVRALSIQEFEKQYAWHWSKFQQEYHTLMGEQKSMFEKEQRSSIADVSGGSVFKIKR